MTCGVGHRRSLDPALLWLWCRLAATAPIRPLAWELPCALRAALKRPKKKKKVFFKKSIYLSEKGVRRRGQVCLRSKFSKKKKKVYVVLHLVHCGQHRGVKWLWFCSAFMGRTEHRGWS